MNPMVERLMESPIVYRLWIAPFAKQKLRPVLAHTNLSRVRRVLDVGCGPGTNTGIFAKVDYLGIDINPSYVESARRRYQRPFVAADVTTYRVPDHERFDLILVNSLLHHLDDSSIIRLLTHLSGLVTADGRVHILELVMPEHRSVARFLARQDRGRYVRPLSTWSSLIGTVMSPVMVEPYDVGVPGVTLWNMLSYIGRPK